MEADLPLNDLDLPLDGDGATGRWTQNEHNLFVQGLKLYGKEWKKIALMIPTRTVVQIRTHAQKYFQKLAKAGYACNERGQIEEAQPASQTSYSTSDPVRSSRRPIVNRKYTDSDMIVEGYLPRASNPAPTTPASTSRSLTGAIHSTRSSARGDSSTLTAATGEEGSDEPADYSSEGGYSHEVHPAAGTTAVGDYGLLQARAYDPSGNIIKVKVRRVHETIQDNVEGQSYDTSGSNIDQMPPLEPTPDRPFDFGMSGGMYRDVRSHSAHEPELAWELQHSPPRNDNRKRSYSNVITSSGPSPRRPGLRIDLSRVGGKEEPTTETDAAATFQSYRAMAGGESSAAAQALAEALAGTLTPGSGTGMSPNFRAMSIGTPGRRQNRSRLPSVLSPLDSDSDEEGAGAHPHLQAVSHAVPESFSFQDRRLQEFWVTPTNSQAADLVKATISKPTLHSDGDAAQAALNAYLGTAGRPLHTSFSLLSGAPPAPQAWGASIPLVQLAHGDGLHHPSLHPPLQPPQPLGKHPDAFDALIVSPDTSPLVSETSTLQASFDPDEFLN